MCYSKRMAGKFSIDAILTDPPYYDNIYYADLSDFFYFYLKQILRKPGDLSFSTIKTPKQTEIIANYYLVNKLQVLLPVQAQHYVSAHNQNSTL